MLTEQFMKVLQPLASQLHAENDAARLRALYLIGSRLSLAIAVPLAVTLILLVRYASTKRPRSSMLRMSSVSLTAHHARRAVLAEYVLRATDT